MIRFIIAAFLIISVCSLMIAVAGCGGSDGPDSIMGDEELQPEPYDPGRNVPGGGGGQVPGDGDSGDGTTPMPPAPPGDGGGGTQPPPSNGGGDGGTITPPPPPNI